MTVCPIAVVAGCAKCPLVSVCPLKSVLGDYKKEEPASDKTAGGPGSGGGARKS